MSLSKLHNLWRDYQSPIECIKSKEKIGGSLILFFALHRYSIKLN